MPFANPLFAPAATRLSFALTGGLVLVLVAEHRHLAQLWSRTLFVRWRTWLISAPIFGAAAMGPIELTFAFALGLTLLGLHEYSRLTDLPTTHGRVLVGAGTVVVLGAAAGELGAGLILAGLTLASLPLAQQDCKRGPEYSGTSLMGLLYVAGAISCLLSLKRLPDGSGLLLALGSAVAISDVVAFCFGNAFGKRALAAQLSPSKTRAGAVGNVVGAYAGWALMGFALPGWLVPALAWSLPLGIAIACIAGDLFESMLKRSRGVKDAGAWLPGFGGLLDRIDSLLFALPLMLVVASVAS